MTDVMFVAMRWMHIVSMAILVGGLLYGRFVIVPAAAVLAPDACESLGSAAATKFRPFVFAAIGGLIVSGLFNLLSTPGHRPVYQMLFGLKMLLSLHVFAVGLLITQPKNPRRTRMMTGTVISGLLVVVLAECMRLVY